MAIDQATPRPRRAVLAAALGGAAAAVATQLARPGVAAAASAPLMSEVSNSTGATTTVAASAGGFDVFTVTSPGPAGTAIRGATTAKGIGIVGTCPDGYGVVGGTSSGIAMMGVALTGTGVMGRVGSTVPAAPVGVALYGAVSAPTQTGIEAEGRIVLRDRSGRRQVAKGRSSVTVTVPGVKSTNFAIATLGVHRSGRWVAAVVCGTNRITIYLNAAVTASTWVSWLVLG